MKVMDVPGGGTSGDSAVELLAERFDALLADMAAVGPGLTFRRVVVAGRTGR